MLQVTTSAIEEILLSIVILVYTPYTVYGPVYNMRHCAAIDCRSASQEEFLLVRPSRPGVIIIRNPFSSCSYEQVGRGDFFYMTPGQVKVGNPWPCLSTPVLAHLEAMDRPIECRL